MTHDYLVVQLLDQSALYRADVSWLGRVELRPATVDTPLERAAISASLATLTPGIDGDHCMRLCTRVNATSVFEAEDAARLAFEETVDVLDSGNWGGARFSLYEAGFSRCISDGRITPRASHQSGPFPAYFVGSEHLPAPTMQQFLLLEPRCELAQRVVRATHWLRVARNEASRHRALLFRWFAIEAIWKPLMWRHLLSGH